MFYPYKDLKALSAITSDGSRFKVNDMLFDDLHWTARYLVIDTHNWLPGGKKLLISPISIDTVDADNQVLQLNISKDQLLNAPSLDEHAPISKHYEKTFFQYYGYGFYWMYGGMWGATANPMTLREPINAGISEGENIDYHLRSINEVLGYKLHAKDRSFGHIEDFLLSTEHWAIAFIAANTRNWLPGGAHVLLAPDHFTSVEWADQEIMLGMTKEEIKNSPPYDPLQPNRSAIFALEQQVQHKVS